MGEEGSTEQDRWELPGHADSCACALWRKCTRTATTWGRTDQPEGRPRELFNLRSVKFTGCAHAAGARTQGARAPLGASLPDGDEVSTEADLASSHVIGCACGRGSYTGSEGPPEGEGGEEEGSDEEDLEGLEELDDEALARRLQQHEDRAHYRRLLELAGVGEL